MKVVGIDGELELARAEEPVRGLVIPPCPALLSALQKEMRQADPDPAEVTRIAASDVALAAALLRFANSPYFARARPAQTVAEAVAMLGTGQAAAILTAGLARHAIRVYPPVAEHFWDTSMRRSLAMAHMARQLYGVDAELAQTCGLFLHLGIPVLLQGVPGYADTLTEAVARRDRGFTETERATHRTDHAVVGAIVARSWRLPSVIVHAIRLHHDYALLRNASIPTEVRTLVALAAVAEHLVSDFERATPQREWERHGASCLNYLQIGMAEVDVWVDALQPLFEGMLLA